MLKKQRYITLMIVIAATVMVGMLLPLYMDETPRDFTDPFYFTPRPTSTRFSQQISNVMEVFESKPEVEVLERTETNCTYPAIYWQDHPQSWPAEVVMGDMVFDKDQVRQMFADPNPDTQTLLIRQVYVAFLNILHGANMNVIEQTLSDAMAWLTSNPPGKDLSEFNRQQGSYLTQVLENYNYGEIGPGLCKGAPGTATPTPPPTLTWTPQPATATPVPPTPAPTQAPAATRTPPPPPPQATTALPTATQPPPATQPPASSTPLLPTATSAPTLPPPPTEAPTSVPLPSPTSVPASPTPVPPTAPPPTVAPSTPPSPATPTDSAPAATDSPLLYDPTQTPNPPPGQTRRPPTNTPKP